MKKDKKNITLLILMAVAAVAISVVSVITNQKLWKILPIYISLIVFWLNSRVDRRAFLLGSISSALYFAVYLSYRLYALAAYNILIGVPLQLFAFIRWSKRPYQNSTMLRSLTWKQRGAISAAAIVGWIAVYVILSRFNAGYLVLDNTVTMVGMLAAILALFPFKEYIWLNVMTLICSVVLYAVMIPQNPEQLTYLIYATYALICSIIAVVQSNKLYKIQQPT